MHTQIVRSLRIRHAPLFDQPHSLKLELARKLPPLHDSPPVPSKHLTRCLRNRVQAKWQRFNLFHLSANPLSTSRSIPAPWDPESSAIKWNVSHLLRDFKKEWR